MTIIDQEISAFLAAHPDLEILEVLIPDINGIFRGKQMPIAGLAKLAKNGVPFSTTAVFLMPNGATADTLPEKYDCDPDRMCFAVPGTLKRVPWAKRPMAQILITMQGAEGEPYFMDPRTLLKKALKPYDAMGLKPMIALEYEFYLFEASSMPPVAVAPPNGMPRAAGANCYNMDVFYDYEEILREIEDACKLQDVDVCELYGKTTR